MIDLSRARIPPRSYQIIGSEKIVELPYLMIGDEMRLGKSKQAIDGAQVLMHVEDKIDRVIIVCLNQNKPVWADPNFGQLAQHLWSGTSNKVTVYHSKNTHWKTAGPGKMKYWIVTNYEFIRDEYRLASLMQYCDKRTMLILDESSAVKNYRSQQTQACLDLRIKSSRIVLLNGTPIAHSPGDMFAQGEMMHPSILEVSRKTKDGRWKPMTGWYPFKFRYGVLGGWQNKQIIGWRNLDDMQRRFAPYVIRRLTADCFDLPPREYEVLSVPLKSETWRVYKEMRDELISWLTKTDVAIVTQAGVKAMRLAQLTSGFVGGVECETCYGSGCPSCKGAALREVGREKLDFFLDWLASRIEEDSSFKIVIWCRFRPELARLHKAIFDDPRFENLIVEQIHGGQNKEDRQRALELMLPRTAPPGAAALMGTVQTGSMGFDMSAAHHEIYLSNDRRLINRTQSEARCAGPLQKLPVWIGDVMATGPEGQKTIDHAVMKSLKAGEDLSTWTTSAWVQALREE